MKITGINNYYLFSSIILNRKSQLSSILGHSSDTFTLRYY